MKVFHIPADMFMYVVFTPVQVIEAIEDPVYIEPDNSSIDATDEPPTNSAPTAIIYLIPNYIRADGMLSQYVRDSAYEIRVGLYNFQVSQRLL